ncbi:MAG: helix-turn-helix transcriptional regulator, partial [Gemmatimonadales bacterium]
HILDPMPPRRDTRSEPPSSDRVSKAARWLDLIAFLLQHRFPVTREQIFERVAGYREPLEHDADPASVRQAFERDKRELRAARIEIETVDVPDAAGDEPATAYRLKPDDFYLPYLELREERAPERPYPGVRSIRLSGDELELLERGTRRVAQSPGFPLAAAAESARRKLAFDLPIPLARIERVLLAPAAQATTATLALFQQAVAHRTRVRCRYYSIGRDALDERELEPYGLFFSWGHWYCVAGGGGGGGGFKGSRVFRLDRVEDAELLTGRGTSFEPPRDLSMRSFLGRAPWELSERAVQRVVVRFPFPESRWVLAEPFARVVDPIEPDGGASLAFAVRDEPPFLRWLLTFRRRVIVTEPAGIRDALEALRRRVAAMYAE